MDGECITVFSSGFYQAGIANMPGYLKIEDGEPIPYSMPALPQLRRDTAQYRRHIDTQFLKDLNCVRHVKSFHGRSTASKSRHSMCVFNMCVMHGSSKRKARSVSSNFLTNL